MLPPPPKPTLFPYTTLFRSEHSVARSFDSETGNIWFERVEHTWVADKCQYCGANRRDYDRGEALETHAYALDRKSTRLNSSHSSISYAVFCLKKKKNKSSIR